jgi:hypothetical protein
VSSAKRMPSNSPSVPSSRAIRFVSSFTPTRSTSARSFRHSSRRQHWCKALCRCSIATTRSARSAASFVSPMTASGCPRTSQPSQYGTVVRRLTVELPEVFDLRQLVHEARGQEQRASRNAFARFKDGRKLILAAVERRSPLPAAVTLFRNAGAVLAKWPETLRARNRRAKGSH